MYSAVILYIYLKDKIKPKIANIITIICIAIKFYPNKTFFFLIITILLGYGKAINITRLNKCRNISI
jgi:hypothetical protein